MTPKQELVNLEALSDHHMATVSNSYLSRTVGFHVSPTNDGTRRALFKMYDLPQTDLRSLLHIVAQRYLDEQVSTAAEYVPHWKMTSSTIELSIMLITLGFGLEQPPNLVLEFHGPTFLLKRPLPQPLLTHERCVELGTEFYQEVFKDTKGTFAAAALTNFKLRFTNRINFVHSNPKELERCLNEFHRVLTYIRHLELTCSEVLKAMEADQNFFTIVSMVNKIGIEANQFKA